MRLSYHWGGAAKNTQMVRHPARVFSFISRLGDVEGTFAIHVSSHILCSAAMSSNNVHKPDEPLLVCGIQFNNPQIRVLPEPFFQIIAGVKFSGRRF